MNFNLSNYRYTNDWFSPCELKNNLYRFVDTSAKRNMLEIGSYEGLSACFFSENFLDHPESTLICVDPFDLSDVTTPLTDMTKENFLFNIRNSKNASKITLKDTYSNKFFPENKEKFDIIYIDGTHLEADIIHDMTEADKVLKSGGIMWMDDYMGGNIANGNIRKTMDGFVEENKARYQVIHKGYQLALRKL